MKHHSNSQYRNKNGRFAPKFTVKKIGTPKILQIKYEYEVLAPKPKWTTEKHEKMVYKDGYYKAEIKTVNGSFQFCDYEGCGKTYYSLKDWEFLGKVAKKITETFHD